MADHYDTLGVSRDATAEEIKRSYRRLARQHHPDANPDDPRAAERFRAVSEAYEVLSDPAKRRNYDMFGDQRTSGFDVGFGGFGGLGGISDIFDTFFGGGTGAGRPGPAAGSDVLAQVELTLEEAAEGVERDVEVSVLDECPDCHGSRAAPGTFPSRCPECQGTGQVRHVRRTVFGDMMTATTCRRCNGRGQEITTPCPTCSGHGRIPVSRSLTVDIPAGVDDGAQLRVTGHGEAGERGGRKGDLYVEIRVLPHEIFKRAGDDLGCEVVVPMTVAALGGTVQIPTLDGYEDHAIEPGTQSGEVIRFRNKGMPRLNGRGRGMLVALLKVETPRDLSREEAELVARLAELRGEEAGHSGFFDRVKEAFK